MQLIIIVIQLIAPQRKHPDDVTIISLAPLTNVALAVEADPSFAMMLKTLIIMGKCYETRRPCSHLLGGGVYIDSNDTPNNASGEMKRPLL